MRSWLAKAATKTCDKQEHSDNKTNNRDSNDPAKSESGRIGHLVKIFIDRTCYRFMYGVREEVVAVRTRCMHGCGYAEREQRGGQQAFTSHCDDFGREGTGEQGLI